MKAVEEIIEGTEGAKKKEVPKGQREERKPKWTVPFYIF